MFQRGPCPLLAPRLRQGRAVTAIRIADFTPARAIAALIGSNRFADKVAASAVLRPALHLRLAPRLRQGRAVTAIRIADFTPARAIAALIGSNRFADKVAASAVLRPALHLRLAPRLRQGRAVTAIRIADFTPARAIAALIVSNRFADKVAVSVGLRLALPLREGRAVTAIRIAVFT